MNIASLELVDLLVNLEKKALADIPLTFDEALSVLQFDSTRLFTLLAVTDRVRREHKQDKISLCSIVNAKSGGCPEDCAFCSQSVHASSKVEEFDFISDKKVLDGATEALENGAHKYGIVTSGYGLADDKKKIDINPIIAYLEKLKSNIDIHRCASLGIIDYQSAVKLKEAGLIEYHHNLETARSFFPQICTTHDYEDDINSVKAAKQAGLKVCSGAIFGIGESDEQRVELAFTLKELDVDSIPINILNPIKGTKLENSKPLSPIKILTIIAMFRLMMPTKDIKVAGGREKNLRDLQSLIFAAGANSTMVGSYLTTTGRDGALDLQMINDLGLSTI
ncbi:MAG: biotin synthase BioB [Nitrospinota bacterium]